MYRPRSDTPVRCDVKNIIKFVRENEMLALLAAALLERWPQVGRVMFTFA